MAKMPKDYSRHENKLIGNLSIKAVVSLGSTLFLLFLLIKSTLPLVLKLILIWPLLALGLLITFFKNTEGDDFLTYIFNCIIFYSTPKNLVFKREINDEGDDK